MQNLNRRLPANSGQNVGVKGAYVWLKSSTGQVQIKTDKGDTAVLNSGDFVRFDKVFSEFFVNDLSGAQNDLTFVISSGDGDAGKFGNVSIQAASALNDVVDVTVTAGAATLLIAANSTRSEVIITSLDSNANKSRIGSADVAANRGTPLAVGSSIVLSTSAAIYCFNAAADSFAITEIGF
tara:strand:- start:1946 stop:2488 length:543 start_codon:yes stop_codon:yes gene_type:complete